MEDVYEELVRWYLRFNGYLCVENFVVHEPDASAQTVPQGAEIDTLAVRFPFSNEVIPATPQKHVLHDPRLECPSPRHIDCIIAEIKGGERIRLNSIWREQTEQARRRVQYIVRWLGCIEDEQRLAQISADLQTNLHAEEGPYFFRVILFARRSICRLALPSSHSKTLHVFS
jgi:hypothetical protein